MSALHKLVLVSKLPYLTQSWKTCWYSLHISWLWLPNFRDLAAQEQLLPTACWWNSLRTHWVLVVMDHFTRRIIGFGVHSSDVDGVALCSMFNEAISSETIPIHLSSDNNPLFLYYQWQVNLRILDVEEVKSILYTPTSHLFIVRFIGTIPREDLDQLFFWNKSDLEQKLEIFAHYYNQHRVHQSLSG